MISAIAGSSNTAPNGSPFAAVDKGFQCRAPPMITRRIDAASATHGAVAARQRAGATSCCAAVIVEDEDPATDRARARACAVRPARCGVRAYALGPGISKQGSVSLHSSNSMLHSGPCTGTILQPRLHGAIALIPTRNPLV